MIDTLQATTITALDAAYENLLLSMNRPVALRTSDPYLRGRLFEVDELTQAFKTYLTALLEDTAGHAHFSHPMHEIVDRYISDMAGEIRDQFVIAIKEQTA